MAAGVERGGGGFISWLFGLGDSQRKHTKLQVDKAKPVLVEPSALSGLLEKKGTATFVVVGGGYKIVFGEVRSPGELLLFNDQAEATAHRAQSIRQQNKVHTNKSSNDNNDDEDNEEEQGKDGDTGVKKKNPFMKGFGALAKGLGLPSSSDKKKTKKHHHDDDDNGPSVDLIEPLLTLKLTLVVNISIVPSAKKGKDGGVHLRLELTEETLDLKFKLTEDAERWKEGLEAWKKYALDFSSFYGEGKRKICLFDWLIICLFYLFCIN